MCPVVGKVRKDGVMEWKSQAGLLYADDVCLMANSEEDMKVIMEKVNECVVEYGYGLKVNEKKSNSKVVCINGEVGRRRWMMGDCCIGEVEEYKYSGITIEGGKHGGYSVSVSVFRRTLLGYYAEGMHANF